MSDRLGRPEWLDAGLVHLAEAGPAGLAIPAIAKRLGVTKGSFYWHFRDLEDFKAALLAEWERRYTNEVMELVDEAGGDPAERLRRLVDLAFETDTQLARAVRHWSADDARARRAQRRVDRRRLTYVAGLLHEIGWDAKDAGALAHWTYCAVIGLHATKAPKPDRAALDVILRTLRPRRRDD